MPGLCMPSLARPPLTDFAFLLYTVCSPTSAGPLSFTVTPFDSPLTLVDHTLTHRS
jgi:hypothetical protein